MTYALVASFCWPVMVNGIVHSKCADYRPEEPTLYAELADCRRDRDAIVERARGPLGLDAHGFCVPPEQIAGGQ